MGPNIDSIASKGKFFDVSYSVTFLPFIAISFVPVLSKSAASLACSFLLAGTVSDISIPLASKNLDALVQVVQPFL